MKYKISFFIFIFFTVYLLQTCIEPYAPDIETEDIEKYVVNGQITNETGYHTVSVSIASSLAMHNNIPLGNCIVKILDDQNNTIQLEEFEDGKYRAWIDQTFLVPGNSFKLLIITPSNVIIESDYDTMYECSEVDSIYYVREDIPTDNPELDINGIQFYMDYKGNSTSGNYIRWELEETWEYHAAYPKENYYDEQMFTIDPPDSSTFYCWKTETIAEIFTLSINNLTDNQYTKYTLHFVNNKTQRLEYGYSLLVKQFGISENAYIYWDQLRNNNIGQGSLYESQPMQVVGNLKNKTDSDVAVLGFFNAISVKTKRIFVDPIDDLELRYPRFCAPDSLDRDGWESFRPFPVYFVIRDDRIGVLNSKFCYDCEALEGVVEKPEFWPY